MSLAVPKTRTFKKKNRHLAYILLLIAATSQLLPVVMLVIKVFRRLRYGTGTPIILSRLELTLAVIFFVFASLVVYMTEANRLRISPEGVEISLPGSKLFTSWDNIVELTEQKSQFGPRYKLHLKNPIPIQHSPDWWPFQKNKLIPKLDLTAYLRSIDFNEFHEIMQLHTS